MKIWIKTMLALSGLCLAACSDDPDVAPLKRDTDAIELAYNAGAQERISVRYAGSWSARVECVNEDGTSGSPWFVISPSQGVGNGRDYQWVTITAERNPGDKRTGYVYLKPSGGEELKIEISQSDGHFTVKDPIISGTLKSNTESSAILEITYDKAFGEETVEITASLSGAGAEGLQIIEEYHSVIEREGSGTISVPITGTPESMGELVCNVIFKLDGEVVFQGDIQGSVTSSNEVFRMGFDLFAWGGNYPANAKGPGPNGSTQPNNSFMGDEPAEPDMITAGTDGSSDVFNTMTETYRINRGVTDWSGLRVYEHPGYVKLGVTANGGWIMTPELDGLTSAPQTVVVSIDFLRFDNENGTYIVSAEGAGVVTNGEVNSTVLPAQTSAANRKWTTLTFTVLNATNKTRIRIGAQTMGETGYRINIDNVVVMGPEQAAVTEKLPAVDADKIAFVPEATAIAFEWEGIKGATSYDVSIAKQASQDYRKTINTEKSSCEFTDLEPGLYVFTAKALYAPNTDFNSDETSKIVGTLGFAVVKLDTPTGLATSEIGSSGAKISWDAVSGAANYRITVTPTEGGTPVTAVVSSAEYTVGNLAPATEYTVTVQALVGDGTTPNEFDSDEVSIQFTTTDPVPMTAPAATLYAKTHGYAIIAWELSAQALAERAVSGSDTYDFRLKDASGTVIGSRTIENFSAFAFARYKFYRFGFGGLAPGTNYTMEMRRKVTAATIDAAQYLDSEWVSVPVTTDAAPDTTGYLFYADFENYPYGAEPLMCAYGLAIGSGISDHTSEMKFGISTSLNTVYTPTSLWNSSNSNATFCEAYAPMFDAAELRDTNLNYNINLAMGVLKFGGGSNPGWLTLPKLMSLSSPTDIVLEFDASPYYEPGSGANAGAMDNNHAAAEGIEFYVRVTGATVTEADGMAINASGDVLLSNVKAADMSGVGAEALKKYIHTPHTVKISGATAATRITIHTDMAASGNRRMWLDNIRVRKSD